MNDFKLVPTTRLRFVKRDVPTEPGVARELRILQQWWAEDMPGYMRSQARGEWRDVPLETESGG